MDKSWFLLKQVHYYPAPDDCIRQGIPDAPLCLGHLVPSLRHLDHVINADEFLPFEKGMLPRDPVTTFDFKRDDDKEHGVDLINQASIPVLDASFSAGFAFSKRVTRLDEFARLDRWTISPMRSYINRCLETKEVADYIKRTSFIPGQWTFYMVTGLAIARGVGPTSSTESSGFETENGFMVPVSDLPNIGPEVQIESSKFSQMASSQATDFIWAIRLAKINKTCFRRDWSIETVQVKNPSWEDTQQSPEAQLKPKSARQGIAQMLKSWEWKTSRTSLRRRGLSGVRERAKG